MQLPGEETVGRALGWWSRRVSRYALWTLVATVVVVVLVGRYSVVNLGIDTDTADMISEHLDWRQTQEEFRQQFPQLTDNILVVVQGHTPELAEEGRQRLAEALTRRPELYRDVHLPGGGDFFDRHGLLFRSVEDLERTVESVERFGYWLRRLEGDPTLTGYMDLLEGAMHDRARGTGPAAALNLAPLLGVTAEAFGAVADRRFHQVSWQQILEARQLTRADRRRFIVLRPELDFTRLRPAGAAVEGIRTVADSLGLTPASGVSVRVTGKAAMEDEELVSVQEGGMLAGTLALIMVLVILYAGLRSPRLIFAAFFTLLAGLMVTAGFATWAVGRLNLISVAFAILYIGLGVDYAIHLCMRYRELVDKGNPSPPSLHRAVEDVGPSLAVSALTTSACFYAFVPTDFAGVSELGLIAGTGMFISLAATVTLIPAVLTLLPLPETARPGDAPSGDAAPGKDEPGEVQPGEPKPSRESGLVSDLAWGIVRHRRPVLVATAGVGLLAFALVPAMEFDHDPLNLRDPDTESVVSYRALLADPEATPLTIAILESDLETALRTAAEAERLDVVRSTRTLASFVPGDQEEKFPLLSRIDTLLGPEPEGEVAGSAGLAAALDAVGRLRVRAAVFAGEARPDEVQPLRFLRWEMDRWRRTMDLWPEPDRAFLVEELEESLVGALPGRMEALRTSLEAQPVSLETLPGDLTERWLSPAGLYRVEVVPEESMDDPEALRRFVSTVRDTLPGATGPPVVQLNAGEVVVRAFRTALVWAVAATGLLLLLTLRSVLAAILVLVPLLLAGLLTGAVAALVGQPFNFANIIALPLILGVGVDNGIHMVHRVRLALPGDRSILHTSTARAVVVSFMTTILSFGNLTFSSHQGMSGMGVLLTLGMASALACTLVVLPALLEEFADRIRRK